MNSAAPSTSAPRGWNALVGAGTAILGFGLPFSTAAVSTGGGLLVLALLLRPRLLLQARPWREPVMAIGLILLAYIAMRTVGQDGLSSWRRLNQYHELLLGPLLLALWGLPLHRRILFRAFIAGCVFASLMFWVTLPVEAWRLESQTHRISASLALAIASYLLVVRAPAGPRKRASLACALFFVVTLLFAMDARTGQLALLLLAAAAAWVRAPRRWRAAAAVAVPLALVATALLSPRVQVRIVEVQAAFHRTTPPSENDSSGVRIQLIRIAAEAVREHWLEGVGYANYAKAHEAAAQELYKDEPARDAFMRGFWARIGNPHDEYALQLVGGGIAGLLLFLAWLGAAFWQARRMPPQLASSLAGVTLAFAFACIFNSLLLDFVEGHLYAAMLAWFIAQARAPQEDSRIARIVVVATRQIGDVLLATPLICAARERWPDARVDVIGFAGTLGMLRGNADVNELIETPADNWGGWALLRRVWRRWDLALVTDVGDRAHLLGCIAARYRSGIIPAGSSSNWWKRMLLDHAVVAAGDRGDRHVVAEKLELLAPWAKLSAAPSVRVPEARELPAAIASRLRAPFVVVHAPSMWPYKQWPLAHFQQLVRGLCAQGHQVVLTGSASRRDQECMEPLRDIEGVLDASGQLDFNQLVTLLESAALYIGPDTSVSHLAAASGVPVIAIFGPTNPVRWAPWPAKVQGEVRFERRGPVQRAGNVTVLQSELHCVPCGRAGCEDHRQSRSDCLADISPQRVLAEAERLLSARPAPG
jgi:heptosyltransferase-3